MVIYCVEDETNIRELMVYTLKASGFDVQGFENSEGFWSAVRKQQPELIILDIMMPGEDGLTVLRKLRSSRQRQTSRSSWRLPGTVSMTR